MKFLVELEELLVDVEEVEGGTPVNPPQDDPSDLIPKAAGESIARRMAGATAYALGEPRTE